MAAGKSRQGSHRGNVSAIVTAVAMLLVPLPAAGQHAVDPILTGSLFDWPRAISQASLIQLRQGLEALRRDDYPLARSLRDAMPERSLDRKLLEWSLAYYGGRRMPATDVLKVHGQMPDWPGGDRLRIAAEESFAASVPATADVLDFFGSEAPLTFSGAELLATALLESGASERIPAVLAPFWRKEELAADDETRILTSFSPYLSQADHRYRMETMLYRSRTGSAARLSGPAGATDLAAAWIAVLKRSKNAGPLLDAVPASQRSAGYHFAKAQWLRRNGDLTAAGRELNAITAELNDDIAPDTRWEERRIVSRALIDDGQTALAYALAAGHGAETPTSFAEAEFHAGWFALRFNNDPVAAAPHFDRILTIADGPITRSRAFYWLGRCAEARKDDSAAIDHYRQAAAFSTSFYGQLAQARLGGTITIAAVPGAGLMDRARFHSREQVRAIERLHDAGASWRASALYYGLAESLESPMEITLLAEHAASRGNHYVALKIAKIAAARGLEIGTLTHPIGAIPPDTGLSEPELALAYAVGRQESEFNSGAISPAGARGLLQLLPSTAQAVAKRMGVTYSAAALTGDPGLNATLGAKYLEEQLQRFDGSYILTFIAYNAGPRRASQWIERYGDPRGMKLEAVIDWIERIPFTETRSYVQRVLENYQVYDTLLGGEADLVSDLVNGQSALVQTR
jgi:soluble lytic murein transglycosylase